MCEFFSAIVTKDGRILFTEQDSHSETIRRAGLRDENLFTRSWVRIECIPPHDSVRVDEQGTLPGWWEENETALTERVIVLALRVAPARATYNKAVAPARAAYNKAVAPARAAYNKAVASAEAAYNKAVAPALAAYDKAVASAEAAYDKAAASADAAYINTLKKISGYMP